MCKICSKLPNKTQEWREWDHPSVFTVNFKTIQHIFLEFPFLSQQQRATKYVRTRKYIRSYSIVQKFLTTNKR